MDDNWGLDDIRSWYKERFADSENDNDTVRAAFDVLFARVKTLEAERDGLRAALGILTMRNQNGDWFYRLWNETPMEIDKRVKRKLNKAMRNED